MVYHLAAVTKFFVIPRNEPDTMVTESNPSPGIKSGRDGIAVKVARHNLVLSGAQHALEGAF